MDFNKDVIQKSNETPLVAMFSAAWCGPCKVAKPILQRVIGGRDDVDLLIIDVDEHMDIARSNSIRAVPTILLYKDGVPVSRFAAGMSPAMIERWLDYFIIDEKKA